jgi:hypothetical protein
LGRVGGGWIGKRGERSARATDSQSCELMQILHKPYIPDLSTYLVFYLETTRGSSIDPLPRMRTTRTTATTTPTHFKSLYIPDKPRGALPLMMCCNIVP